MAEPSTEFGSQSAYAAQRGLTRAAVSKFLKKLETDEPDKHRRIHALGKKQLDFAYMDEVRRETLDETRSKGVPAGAPAAVQTGVMTSSEDGPDSANSIRRDILAINKQQAELDLLERQKKLLRIEDVTDAMVSAGRKIKQKNDAITAWADEVTKAARHGGAPAVRGVLKKKAQEMNAFLADAMRLMGEEDDG